MHPGVPESALEFKSQLCSSRAWGFEVRDSLGWGFRGREPRGFRAQLHHLRNSTGLDGVESRDVGVRDEL